MRVARSTDKFFYNNIDYANRLLKHLWHYFYKTVLLDSQADKTKKYMAHA